MLHFPLVHDPCLHAWHHGAAVRFISYMCSPSQPNPAIHAQPGNPHKYAQPGPTFIAPRPAPPNGQSSTASSDFFSLFSATVSGGGFYRECVWEVLIEGRGILIVMLKFFSCISLSMHTFAVGPPSHILWNIKWPYLLIVLVAFFVEYWNWKG